MKYCSKRQATLRCIRFSVLLLAAAQVCLAQDQELAKQGYAVLEQHCIRCHGDDFKYPGLDMNERSLLIEKASDTYDTAYLVPGKPDESAILQAVEAGHMPPENQKQLSEDDLATLKSWISAGANFPSQRTDRKTRAFVGERTLLKTIVQDLQKRPAHERSYIRYFSLTHLWNNQQLKDDQLRGVRAAVSKLINSLSSKPRIIPPATVDADGLVLRIDLRDYGWTHRQHWLPLLKEYPYGLRISGEEADQAYELTQCDLPYVRADWFVHAAARPPLYHKLVTLPEYVGIPEKLSMLEHLMNVDVKKNIAKDQVWRAGFTGQKSGVSDNNRIVERHDGRYGYYWASYDSAGNIDRQNFFNFPLGPQFPNTGNVKAFKHDGGEIIFSLPNRLQAYMLVKSSGERIDEGPQEIVRDPNEFAGRFSIVNGISCMGCHKHGMLAFQDAIRPQWQGRAGAAGDKVRRIYPPQAEFDELVQADKERFMAALTKAIGPFLEGAKGNSTAQTFPEPITATSKLYDRVLTIDDIARELGLPKERKDADAAGIKAIASELATVIRLSDRLRRFELGPLANGEVITRSQWEAAATRTSRELGIGTVLEVE